MTNPVQESPLQWKHVLYLAASLGLVLFLVELKHPYYFLQDDSRDLLLPYLAHNYRSLLSGEIAQFNFHQFSGYPSLASGHTTALFPPAYCATWFSTVLFGHCFAAVDILVIGLLFIGGAGWLMFFRLAGLSSQAACWGAIPCSLNSFLIYGGSSWLFIVVTAAFLPWMFYFSVSLWRGSSRKHMIGLVGARLLLGYAGYMEYFLYASLFECCVFLAMTEPWKADARSDQRKLLWRYAWSWILTALLLAPLLLPMWHAVTISEHRQAPLTQWDLLTLRMEPGTWLAGLADPFSQFQTRGIMDALPYLSHLGYVSEGLALLSLYLVFERKLAARQQQFARIVLYLGLVTVLWSMGAFAVLLHVIPIFNRFRWAFKLLLFGNLFLIALAATGADYLLDRVNARRRGLLFGLLVAANLCNFLILYLACSPKPFRTFLDPVPLREPLRDKLLDGKLFTLASRTGGWRLAPTLGFDYATLWGLYHFAGYDPLAPHTNARAAYRLDYEAVYTSPPSALPLDRLRQWGVRWYVTKQPSPEMKAFFLEKGLTIFDQDERRTIYADALGKPFVFREDGSAVPYRIGTNWIRAATAGVVSGPICLNFLWNPFFTATIDGRPVPVGFNSFGQIVLRVPAGSHTVVLRYSDPYLRYGLWIGGLTLLAVVLNASLKGVLAWAHPPARLFARMPG